MESTGTGNKKTEKKDTVTNKNNLKPVAEKKREMGVLKDVPAEPGKLCWLSW